MPMFHAYTNAVPDSTATSVVRPSDWNSVHVEALTITGNTNGQSTYLGSGLVLAGGPNVTLRIAGDTLSISAAGGGGGGAGIQSIAVANSTFTTGQVVFSNANGVSFGSAPGGAITASYTVPTQSTQPSIQSVAVSDSTFTTGQVSFSNANGISFGNSAGAITASYTVPTQSTQPGIQSIAVSNSTYTTGQVSFSNANGISFGNSAGAITASYTVPAQSVQTLNVSAVGNTTGQSASSTYDARTLSYRGAGIVSVGWSNSSLIVSATQSVQPGIQSIAVSNTTYTTGQVVFSNANGLTFGSSAGGAITASYTVPTQSNQTLAAFAVGNTAGQSSSSTYDARTLSIRGTGLVSVGWSNSSLLISASQSNQTVGFYAIGNTTGNSSSTYDARSITFQGVGGISVGNNGAAFVVSGFQPRGFEPYVAPNISTAAFSNGGMYLNPVSAPEFAFSLFRVGLWNSYTNTNVLASTTIAYTVFAGVYTNNAGTLSLASSFSTGLTVSYPATTTTGYNLFSGFRDLNWFNIATATAGIYYLGVGSSRNTTNASVTAGLVCAGQNPLGYAGLYSSSGQTRATDFKGLYTGAVTNTPPSSIALSQVSLAGGLEFTPAYVGFN